MTKQQYEYWSSPYRNTKGKKIIITADKCMTGIVFLPIPFCQVIFFLQEITKTDADDFGSGGFFCNSICIPQMLYGTKAI